MPDINKTIDTFIEADIKVPAPKKGEVTSSVNGYKVLNIDGDNHPIDLEVDYMRCLLFSDVAYIVNPGGYIGATSLTEAAIARKYRIPLLSQEPLDPTLDQNGEYSDLWKQFYKGVLTMSPSQAIKAIKDPIHPIYRHRQEEFLPLSTDELEYLVLHVLNVDWLKHRGLGEVIRWIDEAWSRGLIPRCGPMTRITEYKYDAYTETFVPHLTP